MQIIALDGPIQMLHGVYSISTLHTCCHTFEPDTSVQVLTHTVPLHRSSMLGAYESTLCMKT